MPVQYKRPHHRNITRILNSFNADFFKQHNLMFGDGTRIALELSEYRVSVDVDIVCPSRESYRSVREQVNNNSLGSLVTTHLEHPRGVRADRDAVRTLVMVNDTPVKVEIINFENYELNSDPNTDIFPVPCLDRTSCFYTKLLANADRYYNQPQKDIFDILAMTKEWGDIPGRAIVLAEEHYSPAVVIPNLKKALDKLVGDPKKFHESTNQMGISPIWAHDLMEQAHKLRKGFRNELNNKEREEPEFSRPKM